MVLAQGKMVPGAFHRLIYHIWDAVPIFAKEGVGFLNDQLCIAAHDPLGRTSYGA